MTNNQNIERISEGVYKISLELPASLESNRYEFNRMILNAQEKIHAFTKKHNWQSYVNIPLITRLKIFTSKKQFDDAIIVGFNLPEDTDVPSGAVAVIANDILFMVTPEVYQDVYPQGQEEDCYEKLMMHELAHVLHIRILHGDEEKMGPKWFYEGFAVHVANQFQDFENKLSKKEIGTIVSTDEEVGYQNYKEIMECLLHSSNLKDLVDQAWRPDFIQMVSDRLNIRL